MEVIRVVKNKDYTVICNKVFKNKSLSIKAKGMLALILSLSDDWNLSIKGLTMICKEGQRSIRNIFQELIDQGYIKRQIERSKGKIVKWTYIIYEDNNMNKLHLQNVQVENIEQYNNKDNKIIIKNKDIQKRKDEFIEEVFYLRKDILEIEEMDRFVEYWTETNKSKTKMRFEMQKTWDTKMRMQNWGRNTKKWGGKTMSTIDNQINEYLKGKELL
jgi:hypothetical protein